MQRYFRRGCPQAALSFARDDPITPHCRVAAVCRKHRKRDFTRRGPEARRIKNAKTKLRDEVLELKLKIFEPPGAKHVCFICVPKNKRVFCMILFYLEFFLDVEAKRAG